MPAHITIITPIKNLECRGLPPISPRQYGAAIHSASCNAPQQFRFDLIPNLHFASFVMLDAAADFGPNLVFEATFDGSKEDFLSDLLRVAGNGIARALSALRRLSARRPPTPQLAKEYFLDHDAGAHIYSSPAAPAAPLRRSRTKIGSTQRSSAIFPDCRALPPRMNALFDALRGFIAARQVSAGRNSRPPCRGR